MDKGTAAVFAALVGAVGAVALLLVQTVADLGNRVAIVELLVDQLRFRDGGGR